MGYYFYLTCHYFKSVSLFRPNLRQILIRFSFFLWMYVPVYVSGRGSMLTSSVSWDSGPEVLCPILTVALHTTGPWTNRAARHTHSKARGIMQHAITCKSATCLHSLHLSRNIHVNSIHSCLLIWTSNLFSSFPFSNSSSYRTLGQSKQNIINIALLQNKLPFLFLTL